MLGWRKKGFSLDADEMDDSMIVKDCISGSFTLALHPLTSLPLFLVILHPEPLMLNNLCFRGFKDTKEHVDAALELKDFWKLRCSL